MNFIRVPKFYMHFKMLEHDLFEDQQDFIYFDTSNYDLKLLFHIMILYHITVYKQCKDCKYFISLGALIEKREKDILKCT